MGRNLRFHIQEEEFEFENIPPVNEGTYKIVIKLVCSNCGKIMQRTVSHDEFQEVRKITWKCRDCKTISEVMTRK